MTVLVSRDFLFEAAHRLEEYRGKCEALHGHTWKIRVTVGAAVKGDGLAFDFAELSREVKEHVLSRLDHSYLNELIPIPSAERIAIWIWQSLCHLPLVEIKVWETPDCGVTYDGRDERE